MSDKQLLCLERWTASLDSGKSIDVAYFDYSFDKVSHRLLLIKLKGYGINGRLLKWLEAYLKDRGMPSHHGWRY